MEFNTENVNDRQVGGAHYASTYQHWDFVLDTYQSYLQGNGTKYVSRWRKKNGREDLEKALHYCEKAAAEKRSGSERDPQKLVEDILRFGRANSLPSADIEIIYFIVFEQWSQAITLLSAMIKGLEAPLQPM